MHKEPLDMLQQLSDFYRDNSELYSSFDINSYEQLTASEMAQFVLSVPQKLDVVLEDKSLEITPLGSFEIWSENLFRIEKDVVRTDRNHSFYPSIETSDPSEMISKCPKMGLLRDILMTFTSSFPNNEPGFVQGMADLCSPLLIHIEDESEAFWCFAGLMNKKKENFNNDGAGIKRQLELLRKLLKVMDLPLYTKLNEIGSMNLFCAFRWILVLFKREFPFEQTMKLWDTCFSNYYSTDFHIFICLTIFETHRNEIIGHIEDTDELLCFIHGLSNKMDSDAILASAEDLFLQFKKICKAQGCLQEGRLDLEKVLGSF
ncbi:hypothetical protein HK103_006131 [Boothiomyces macroporosus]|uniref:Rab-GAP TBC domain-containing protein n=1 Tax=Boothiomyces macroporosus TaxID=261099 RepID=A0AAD5UHC3_9FUNG|nr:hypothetical protein HK103_006131 [Boothiomyces macroporosus]